MVYIYNKNIIYIFFLFIYIIIYDFIIQPALLKLFLYLMIIVLIVLKEKSNHWDKNHRGLFIGIILLSIFNGLKFHYYGGWIVNDEYYSGSLKYYYFVKINELNVNGQWLVKYINNEFVGSFIKPYGIFYGSYNQFKLYIQNKCNGFIIKSLPIHHSFLTGILWSNNQNLKNYQIIKQLGLNYYLTAFSWYFYGIQKIFIILFSIFFKQWPIYNHYLSYGISWILNGIITLANGRINIIRSFCTYSMKIIGILWDISYNPVLVLMILFLILHTYNGIYLYHPSFLIGFFIPLLYHMLNNKSVILLKSYYKFIKIFIINLLFLLFSLFFFQKCIPGGFFLNIIFQDFFIIIFILIFLALLIPGLSYYIEYIITFLFQGINNWKGLSMVIFLDESIGYFPYFLISLFVFFWILSWQFIKIWDLIFYYGIIIGFYYCIS